MGHFNAGNVWGKVIKAKEGKTKEKHTPFLELEIDCSHPQHGPVKAFGRLWGKEKIAVFLESLQEHKVEMFRFKGFYGQYEEHSKRYSSYFFYDFTPPGVLKNGAMGTPRAAFILVGDLTKKELDQDAEPKLYLDVIRPGKETSIEESFEVYLFDLETYYEIETGDLVEVRGVLRKRKAEDEYGGTTDDLIRPYVMVTKKRQRR